MTELERELTRVSWDFNVMSIRQLSISTNTNRDFTNYIVSLQSYQYMGTNHTQQNTTAAQTLLRPKLLLKWLLPAGETYDMLVLISWTGSLGTDWHISQWTSWLTGLHWMRLETPSKSSCHASFHHHYVSVSILVQKHCSSWIESRLLVDKRHHI